MGAGGKGESPPADAASTASTLQQLRTDPRFASFYENSFNVAEFASSALSGAGGGSEGSAQGQIDRIKEGITTLDGIVRTEVTQRQGELLGQAAQLREAEGYLASVSSSIDGVKGGMGRVRGNILEPYSAIKSRTTQLANLLATANMLRSTTHALKLLSKLTAQLGTLEEQKAASAGPGSTAASPGPTAGPGAAAGALASHSGGMLDLAKAAKLIADIEAVLDEVDLSGVSVVDAQMGFLQGSAANVRRDAKRVLLAGIDSLNQAEVGSALQVYFNLHELKKEVHSVLQRYVEQVEEAFTQALDGRKLQAAAAAAAAGPTANSGVTLIKFPDNLWQGLGKAFERLQRVFSGTAHLQRVLAKKRDPLTHAGFLDEVVGPGEQLPLDLVCSKVVGIVRSRMEAAAHPAAGGAVREVLTNSYPRLAAMLEDCCASIHRDTELGATASKGSSAAGNGLSRAQEEALLGVAAPFQAAYLAAVLSRMTDGVSAAFPGGTRALPSSAELQKCIARFHEELKVVSGSPQLAVMLAERGVARALQLLAEKAEFMAATGPDVRQVIGGCNAAQMRNIALCNALQEIYRSLLQLLPKIPPQAAAALRQPLDAVQSAGMEVVTPLIRGMVEAAEETILRMHAADFASEGAAATPALGTSPPATAVGLSRLGSGGGGAAGPQQAAQASQYLVDLTKQLASWRLEYLSKFSPAPSPAVPSVAASLVERMASRLLVFFVRHAALVRPLSARGRQQLAKDAKELEVAVSQHLYPAEHLGTPFRMLRAFRPLLFVDTAHLATSPLLGELPASIVLHQLYSRAPASLQSPAERSGLAPAQYSAWLDQHGMGEVVAGVRKSLEACRDKAQVEEGFEEVYGLMMGLCDAMDVQTGSAAP